jgi:hypothetical protein
MFLNKITVRFSSELTKMNQFSKKLLYIKTFFELFNYFNYLTSPFSIEQVKMNYFFKRLFKVKKKIEPFKLTYHINQLAFNRAS